MKKIFLAWLIIIFIFQTAVSQIVRDNSFITFEQLIFRLGQNNHVQFYYKPEWFEMRTFNSSLLKLSLAAALDRIKSETDFSVFTLDSLLYIFVPVKPVQDTITVQKYTDVITVGNPDEYGKYSKAIIRGIILDGTNGKPLHGASIFIDKLKLGATADNISRRRDFKS